MRPNRGDKNIHVDPGATISLALSKYYLSGANIRQVIRRVLGHAPSKRRIARLSRCDGNKLKQGRPRTIPKIKKRDLHDLIAATSQDPQVFDGHMLHFLHHIELNFGLAPSQYLNWVTGFVRHGKYLMRRCVLRVNLFP